MNSETKEVTELVVVIAWLIWKRRNEFIFEGTNRGIKQIVSYGQTLIKEFQVAQVKLSILVNKPLER